jgi:hypothetical protein
MKQLLSIAAVLMVLFVGCSKMKDSITGPLSMSAQVTNGDLAKSGMPIKSVMTSKLVDGSQGAFIFMNESVLSSEGRVVNISAQIGIPAGAFTGSQEISMEVDVDNGCVYFLPHMNFVLPCDFNYSLQNMNLSNIGFSENDKKADFVYFGETGEIEHVKNKGVGIIFKKGNLQVKNAQLPHFSRYGFIRKSE